MAKAQLVNPMVLESHTGSKEHNCEGEQSSIRHRDVDLGHSESDDEERMPLTPLPDLSGHAEVDA